LVRRAGLVRRPGLVRRAGLVRRPGLVRLSDYEPTERRKEAFMDAVIIWGA
jgi:hypothetical protein